MVPWALTNSSGQRSSLALNLKWLASSTHHQTLKAIIPTPAWPFLPSTHCTVY
uniref:Uncharacterized protein n=1 Tax=Arundo donax TaxID=35708 RepID=A0A0A9FXE6_ARUDO